MLSDSFGFMFEALGILGKYFTFHKVTPGSDYVLIAKRICRSVLLSVVVLSRMSKQIIKFSIEGETNPAKYQVIIGGR